VCTGLHASCQALSCTSYVWRITTLASPRLASPLSLCCRWQVRCGVCLCMFPFFQIRKNNFCSQEAVDTVATENMGNNLLRQHVFRIVTVCITLFTATILTPVYATQPYSWSIIKQLESIALSLNPYFHVRKIWLKSSPTVLLTIIIVYIRCRQS
jgi:hypothetical protein